MHKDGSELEAVSGDLSAHLETWAGFGIGSVPCAAGSKNHTEETSGSSLDELRPGVLRCQKCKDLAKSRKNVVFGSGNSSADLVFVGEAPGYDEDIQGEPFVGKAGQLLTRMIQAMKLTREKVYICNVLKCRPPNNRNPLPEEVTNCSPYLKSQLQIIKPKVLVALGKFAAQTLLNTQTPISRLRGKFSEYEGIPLMPTFHPAYLLRNENDKKLVWEDLKQVMQLLGIAVRSTQ